MWIIKNIFNYNVTFLFCYVEVSLDCLRLIGIHVNNNYKPVYSYYLHISEHGYLDNLFLNLHSLVIICK